MIQGNDFEANECYEEAFKVYKKALAFDANNATGWFCKNYVLSGLGKDQPRVHRCDVALLPWLSARA